MDITVRFAEFNELQRINEIREQVNDLHVSGRPDIFRPGFVTELRQRIYECFDSEECRIIAAFCGETLCGFASVQYVNKPQSPYNLERKIYQVEEIGVDKAYRRKGAGGAMIEFMKRDARKKGFDRIELDMWEFNESALKFYHSAGFSEYRRYMELNMNGYPTVQNAHRFLSEAVKCNPGPWGDHSVVVAKCAKAIAAHCPDMNEEKAYVLGLLHDIGRRFGVSHLRHVYDGYSYMKSLGYPDAARICITHSFPNKIIDDYVGNTDVTDEQKKFIEEKLSSCIYDDYDRLIQLCDAIGMPYGAVPIEVRMNDVKRRYGFYPQEKWNKNIALKGYFEVKAGMNIESLTADITANKDD